MILLALLAAIQASGAGEVPKPQIVGTLVSWFSYNNYPPSAIRKGEQGTVAFTLHVSTTGSVRSCDVTTSSGFADLDEATCQTAMQRAHFTPAVDANGKPVESLFSSKVKWELPPDSGDTPPVVDPIARASVSVDAAGRVTACTPEPIETHVIDLCSNFPVGTVIPISATSPPSTSRLSAVMLLIPDQTNPTPHNP